MNRKTKRQRKILVISLVLAMLIVAGGTFAWFTSKDEVTNKLTASSNYGVSIVESFAAPENWIPGQEVNKDVYVTNTGNVDAFVKVSLSSALELTVAGEPVSTDEFSTTDAAKLVELKKTDESGNMADEVLAVQAGGRLVYSVDTLLTDESDIAVGTDYEPSESGLYVFERNLGSDAAEYAGYYYDADAGKYYALASVNALKGEGDVITGFEAALSTTEIKSLSDDDFEYEYSYNPTLESLCISVFYYNGSKHTGGAIVDEDDIVVRIYMDDDWAKYWFYDVDENTFYYSDSLKAGEASEKLIDSLVLDSEVSNSAYISFEYNLTVSTDSVQVTTDADGKQTADALSWSHIPQLTLDDEGKITSISW